MVPEVNVNGDENKHSGWAWPDWNGQPDPPPRTRKEKLGSILWPAAFLFYLVQPISAAFDPNRPRWQAIVLVVASVEFGASYLIVVARGPRSSPWVRVVMIAWLAAYPIGMAFILGPGMLTFFTYVVSPALFILPSSIAAMLGFGSALSVLIASKVVTGTANWDGAAILVVLTLAMFAFGGLVRSVRELRATQDKMARLAVAEERSRLARDLHDVLGHSLTTITVKAGLARRLLESSTDRQRVIDEVRDVEDLARQTMTDVRATVSGYRSASLPAELVGARAALSAAGIAAELPRAVDNVTARLQETFAYVLREGVTNVIRHSSASRCEVRLGDTWLEVRDNGRCAGTQVTLSRASGGGHGLCGLAERVSAVGGTLDAGPLPEGGFMLRVSVPSPPEPTADQPVTPGLAAEPAVGWA
jgi:two-component system sensor histidine kinase DesK